MLQLALQRGLFHSRPVLTLFTVLILCLLMMVIPKSEPFENVTRSNEALLFLIK